MQYRTAILASLLACSALISASAERHALASPITGFCFSEVHADGSPKTQQDFELEFALMRNVKSLHKFTSIRTYTGVQVGTTADPTAAIPAAIKYDMKILLGMWASLGQASFNDELRAFQTAVETWGTNFTDKIVGIIVGSEDVSRTLVPPSPAVENGPGANVTEILQYIHQTRELLASLHLKIPIGHVEQGVVWTNASNNPIIDSVDWIGLNYYPYYAPNTNNSVTNSQRLFAEDVFRVEAVSQAKPVFLTETGWAISGPGYAEAESGVSQAEYYYHNVGCHWFGKKNVWWYILDDQYNTVPKFDVLNTTTGRTYFDLNCQW